MPGVRRFALALVVALFVWVGVTPTPTADAAPPYFSRCPTANAEFGQSNAPTPPQDFFLGDWRLGPKQLPKSSPIGPIVRFYHRFNGITPRAFLACYWKDTGDPSTSGWWYPKNNGFLTINGEPVVFRVTLRVGQDVDLFGSGQGRFLAPAGTRYGRRAIPPSNLDTYDPSCPFGYHLYDVMAPFTVDAGPIAPWFNQRGGGLQYFTANTTDPNLPPNPRIPDLVASGYLSPPTCLQP
jgi:hypothetical protein